MNKMFNVTFFVTDDCNFNCVYCPQKKEKNYMKRSTVDKTVDFFYPYLKEKSLIVFFGGEPLLAFDLIEYAVARFAEKNKDNGKKIGYSVTTNGSLLDEGMLAFFDRHGIAVVLSFDGLTQESARKPGSLAPTRDLIKRIGEYPGIKLTVNCVFTPGTVPTLNDSVRAIIDSGVNEIMLSPSYIDRWDNTGIQTLKTQLEELSGFFLSHYRDRQKIPLTSFRPPTGEAKQKSGCSGGWDRMSVTPDEQLWGCFVFHPYLKDKKGSEDYDTYSFGSLDDFMANHETIYPRILANHRTLKQECYFTESQPCFLCGEVEDCSACPVDCAYATGFIGKLPPWYCGVSRVLRGVREVFFKKLS